jgi:UDP-N-acetylglucosamine transferase subunit ALG13
LIFVTVGGQLPFDRLVRTVDEWAGRAARHDVLAQVGDSRYRPAHLRAERFLEPREFQRRLAEATALVAHAGMGTILQALELGKPLLVVPRRAALGEHRNDHQLHTARYFAELGSVLVAYTEEEILKQLDRLEQHRGLTPIGPRASTELISRLRAFALGAPGRDRR